MLPVPISHYLLDASLGREIDQRTQEAGINGFTLMEVAGSSAAQWLLSNEPNLTSGLYLCGKGNNAGDALVVARYLTQYDINATVVLLSGTDALSPDTQKNLSLLKKYSSPKNVTIVDGWDQFNPSGKVDFIIDGLLGTGLNAALRGDYRKAASWVNLQKIPAFAMDIPSGLHADSGEVMGAAIHAKRTFAFGGKKIGFYINNGPNYIGTAHYCELPFPKDFKKSCNTYLIDEKWVKTESPTPAKHKYEAGVLYIIAGSAGLTGAAVMAAQSAWAEGLGALILICPKGTLSVYENLLPSVIKKPVGARGDDYFKKEHLQEVLEIVQQRMGNVLIGPGLGRADSTVLFAEGFLAENRYDAVIDADGLWCLAQLKEWPKPDNTRWILTPHPGELARFCNRDTENNRLKAVRELASKYQVTVLSKGMPAVVGTPDGNCYLTDYDTRFFSRAGSGDVLAGKASAYLALGNEPGQSCMQALLNGKKKLDLFLKTKDGIPEPMDFI